MLTCPKQVRLVILFLFAHKNKIKYAWFDIFERLECDIHHYRTKGTNKIHNALIRIASVYRRGKVSGK